MPPRVTIGIPCFNAARWIGAAVRSALGQTWENKAVIVVDDGSTDESPSILAEFGEAIRLVRVPHGGPNRARNLILRAADEGWLQYLDADDFLHADKVRAQLQGVPALENADVIYSPVLREIWDAHGPRSLREEPIDRMTDVFAQYLSWQLPQTGAALWRRSTMENIGGWNEDPAQICDEHDCYLRALRLRARFVYVDGAHAVYREWSADTRCHRDQPAVILCRTALCEALRAWLEGQGAWSDEHRRALGQAWLEMARMLAVNDWPAAAEYHRQRRAEIHLAGPAAPWRYRVAYRMFGFRFAETLARAFRGGSSSH